MRKTVLVLLALALLLAAAVPAQAAKKKKKKRAPKKVERVVEFKYDLPAAGTSTGGGAGGCLTALPSCGNFPPGQGELFIKVELSDTTGLDAPFSMGQDTDPATPFVDTDLGAYCGAMEAPVAIEPGYEVVVWPWFIGSNECPSISTQGTIKATFSNLP